MCAAAPVHAEEATPPAATPAGDVSGDESLPASDEATIDDSADAAPGDTREPVPIDDIRVLVEVFHKIKKDYVEAIDDKTLIENAMRGMLAGLDPHSSYLDPEEYLDLQEGTSGEFGGLGIEVGMEDGFVKVIAPIDGTPAQEAGIQSGDVIVRLDDTPVKGMNLNDAVKKMRGKPGTDIRLTVVREGEEKPLVFTITRALVKVRSVRSRMLEPGYGYIRISQFQGPTGDDLRRHLRDLKNEAGDDGLRGLVLDLRNNPGGILGAAVSVADAFLESGLVVYTEGRIKDSQLEFTAKPPDLLRGAPLIVLVNEGSASASEIVAGALQDQKRALIMGRQTFGKGSVQTILPMNNRAALKLTTARYFTPAGRSIQAEGIVPDIVVDKLKLAARASGNSEVVKEANLERHLVNPEDAVEVDVEDDADAAEGDDDEQPLAERDYELYEALNMLKGMTLLQARSGNNTTATAP
ncbi:MAG: S41 family peptidase [Gammaproteobacteria bacterium]|nr:S41 family peptidase [Gammaproteobacteria bacterium]MCP5199313.1 S41 family peptidase [Gammaproteobacteria bacterium]